MTIRVVTGVLERVVDGDTAHFHLSVGWGITLAPRIGKDPGPGTIRIVFADGSKWDAPERTEDKEGWEAAKRELEQLIFPGLKYTIVSHGYDTMQRRTLGSIRLEDGRDVAAVMQSLGHTKRGQP